MVVSKISDRPYVLKMVGDKVVFSCRSGKLCLKCNQVLSKKRKTALFCSDNCRAKHWNINQKYRHPKLYLIN
jgi:hypothetical protein